MAMNGAESHKKTTQYKTNIASSFRSCYEFILLKQYNNKDKRPPIGTSLLLSMHLFVHIFTATANVPSHFIAAHLRRLLCQFVSMNRIHIMCCYIIYYYSVPLLFVPIATRSQTFINYCILMQFCQTYCSTLVQRSQDFAWEVLTIGPLTSHKFCVPIPWVLLILDFCNNLHANINLNTHIMVMSYVIRLQNTESILFKFEAPSAFLNGIVIVLH